MPKISVIVPVFNTEKYIRRCINSILKQSYKDFELILIDDGSKDLSGKICEEYKSDNNNVRVFHKQNGGAADARNYGIDWVMQNSESEWICFIDSDDWVHEDLLMHLYNNAINYGVRLSCCDTYRTYGEEPDGIVGSCNVTLYTPEEFYIQHTMHVIFPDCKLYHKTLFENIRYPVGRVQEDDFTTYKFVFSCERIAMVDAQLIYYFQNTEGITHGKWNIKRLDGLDAIEEQIAYFNGRNLRQSMMISIRRYCWHYSTFLRAMKEEPDLYSTQILELKKRMRQQLRHYKYDLKVPVIGNEDIYCTAYPHEIALLNRMRKLFHRRAYADMESNSQNE